MPKRITFVLAVLLASGVTGVLASPSLASVASSKSQFCAAVSKDGGMTPFALAAKTGQGAAGLVVPLQQLDAVAPSKHVKSTVKKLEKFFEQIGQGEKVSDLGSTDSAKLNSAITSLSSFVDKTCASTGASSPAAAGGLSGTWSGQYEGPSDGTFTLTWQQSGSDLSGSITISEFGVPININGKLSGGKISFGTVGSLAVTFSGSVSGNTMSGTYHAPNGDGTWNATKGS
jgi:hypothetical protein